MINLFLVKLFIVKIHILSTGHNKHKYLNPAIGTAISENLSKIIILVRNVYQ